MRLTRVAQRAAGYAVLTVTVAIAVTPILWLVLTSLKAPTDLIARPPKVLFWPTLDNYREIFGTRQIPVHRYFVNSVVVTLISTVVSVALAALAAYGLGRLRPRGHRFLSLLILAVRMLPPVALVAPMFLIAS